jgi:hypothetical protein
LAPLLILQKEQEKAEGVSGIAKGGTDNVMHDFSDFGLAESHSQSDRKPAFTSLKRRRGSSDVTRVTYPCHNR